MKKIFTIAGCFLGLWAVTVFAGSDKIQKAQDFLARYIAYEHAFDPAVVDLYAPQARIQNTRYYPNGQSRTMTVPADQYQNLIRLAMPLAKQRGDINDYRDCRYQEEGENVRVVCQRYSHLKKYTSAFSLLIGFGGHEQGVILEEISESQAGR